MYVLGLAGGIGAGKSAVADLLAERGAVVIDADVLAREVVAPGGPARAALLERFGTGILGDDGLVDRPRLAATVFNDPEALADLNGITHPAIGVAMLERRDALAGTDAVVVLAIPLLRAEHRQTVGLDAVVVVDAPQEVALERLTGQRGMAREDAEARIAAQQSPRGPGGRGGLRAGQRGDRRQLAAEVDRLWSWVAARRKD